LSKPAPKLFVPYIDQVAPILIANVYDGITAKAVAALPGCRVLGTASYAVANAAGLEDDDLDMETNLRTAAVVASVARTFGKPLTVDFQDGYGSRLEEGIGKLIDLGVAGINLEDFSQETGKMYPLEEAAHRVKRAVGAATSKGVPDFLINARVDELVHGGTLEDAIARGKAYLAAGAANVFVWGGSKRGGISASEVRDLCQAFEGKLNVSIKLLPRSLSVEGVAKIGVARCSIGPKIQFAAAKSARCYISRFP
jgi:2-methylisocitrate lyase-like PEP mutase family enzyme